MQYCSLYISRPAVLLFGQVGGLVYLRFKKKKNHARKSNEILDKA